MKKTKENNQLKIERRISENDSEEYLDAKQTLKRTQNDLKESIAKFKKTHEIYTQYCLSLTEEKNKLEKNNLQNER